MIIYINLTRFSLNLVELRLINLNLIRLKIELLVKTEQLPFHNTPGNFGNSRCLILSNLPT